jgi:hypothetical protein
MNEKYIFRQGAIMVKQFDELIIEKLGVFKVFFTNRLILYFPKTKREVIRQEYVPNMIVKHSFYFKFSVLISSNRSFGENTAYLIMAC